MRLGRALHHAAGLLALLMLIGCVAQPLPGPVKRPPTSGKPTVPTPPTPPKPSAASARLVRYYGQLQNDLLVRGLLRQDGGGPDTPFTDTTLVENFVQIALFDEYRSGWGGRLVASPTPSRLRRWQAPVHLGLRFGASVPQARRTQIRAQLDAYAARLARLTNHPIRTVEGDGNFTVLILNEDERRAFGPALAKMVPGIVPPAIRNFTDLDRSAFCLVYAFSEPGSQIYRQAVTVIRAEHPPLMFQACLHEEIAQGLGLPNDSPRARPSIFNDDEEFGRLTTHDELLLRLLYNPALRPGMTAEEARPILRDLAAALLPGSS